MTGATRGLGEVAAIKLLTDAPDVHLVLIARSDGANVAQELRERSANAHVSSVQADLSSLDSIRKASAEIKQDLDLEVLPPLSGFIGNAGLQLLRATDASSDGTEQTFAVNVLANYVFVDELRGHFRAPARIVLTTSDTHFGDFSHNMGMVPAPKWRDPARLAAPGSAENASSAVAGRTAYSTSKLAVIYLTHALARQLPPGVETFAFNPGLVPGTGLVRDSGAISRFAFRRIMPVMTLTPYARSLKVSGADLAAAAIGPVAAESGSYINGNKIERSSPESYDPAREDTLWDELTRLTHPQDLALAG
ncbi:MAG: SDR family NAD(P)-dependent oxidoreductase [Actinomycetota bacterium]|nr:SDR family NAD(P)-dependent oxidoreductase [Actinomycetota bacterium]